MRFSTSIALMAAMKQAAADTTSWTNGGSTADTLELTQTQSVEADTTYWNV